MEDTDIDDLSDLKVNKRNQIFLNKILLSSSVVEWEKFMIKAYTEYIDGKNRGTIKDGKEKDWEVWNVCWRWVLWIFSELKHNKIEALKKKDIDAYNQLVGVINKRIKRHELTHDDLVDAVDNLTLFISLAGYHDDTIRGKEGTLDEEEW